MSAKDLGIFLAIVVVIIIGLFIFQQNRQGKDDVSHSIEQYKRIMKVAEKSNSAGMLNMAMAINKFQKKNGHYPKNLMMLHPEFIPYKPFITDLDWNYHLKNKTYMLQKSLAGQSIVASTGPDLKVSTEESGSSVSKKIVVAANTSKTAKSPLKKPAPKPDQVKKVSPQDLMKISAPVKKPEKKTKVVQSKPPSNIIKKGLNKNEKYLLSLNNYGLYIWKTPDGIIGFSDTQYPDEKKLSIFRDQSWIEYINHTDIQ